MISMRSIAEKGYGCYLTLKVLKAIFYPVHILLWAVYAILSSAVIVALGIMKSVVECAEILKLEFPNKFLRGSNHFKNFKRSDYKLIYAKIIDNKESF